MNKMNKKHTQWAILDENHKPMEKTMTLEVLNKVCEFSLHAGWANWGDRVNILMKNGAILRGYVSYISELGGYVIYSNHNVKMINETNTQPINVNEVMAVERSNYSKRGRHIEYLPFDCPILSDVAI